MNLFVVYGGRTRVTHCVAQPDNLLHVYSCQRWFGFYMRVHILMVIVRYCRQQYYCVFLGCFECPILCACQGIDLTQRWICLFLISHGGYFEVCADQSQQNRPLSRGSDSSPSNNQLSFVPLLLSKLTWCLDLSHLAHYSFSITGISQLDATGSFFKINFTRCPEYQHTQL